MDPIISYMCLHPGTLKGQRDHVAHRATVIDSKDGQTPAASPVEISDADRP